LRTAPNHPCAREEEEEEEEGENARGKMDATWDDARRPIRFVREGGRERRRDPAVRSIRESAARKREEERTIARARSDAPCRTGTRVSSA